VTMFMKTLYTPGLAHLSYIFGDAGQASVIDPRRDVNEYLEIAHSRGAKITHIFETHRNEDYVVGSLELARRTGAEIYHGSQLDFQYGNPVNEGDAFQVGNIKLSILHTPSPPREQATGAHARPTAGSSEKCCRRACLRLLPHDRGRSRSGPHHR